MPVVVGVKVIGPFKVEIHFEDGVCRHLDLRDALKGEVFLPLRNPKRFAEVYVDEEAGTIAWPNGADMAPEFLYEAPEIPLEDQEESKNGHV